MLEIAVTGVLLLPPRLLGMRGRKFCILSSTSISIVLHALRENALVLPARRESIPFTTKANPQ